MSEEYGHKRKKIVFYSTDKIHADMKIRLKYDGLTQSSFFRGLITGYVEKDPALVDFIDRLKEELGAQGVTKRRDSKRLLDPAQEVESKFGLNEREVEDIFDIIEKENPEL